MEDQQSTSELVVEMEAREIGEVGEGDEGEGGVWEEPPLAAESRHSSAVSQPSHLLGSATNPQSKRVALDPSLSTDVAELCLAVCFSQ